MISEPLVMLIDTDGPAGTGTVRFQLPYELVEALGKGNINQMSVVENTFVLDYTSPLANAIVKRREVADELARP